MFLIFAAAQEGLGGFPRALNLGGLQWCKALRRLISTVQVPRQSSCVKSGFALSHPTLEREHVLVDRLFRLGCTSPRAYFE